MNPIFIIGTLALIAFLYWAAYQGERALKSNTIEIKGNLLLSIPELIFKVVLIGICLGLATSLEVKPDGVCGTVNSCLGLRSSFPIFVEIIMGLGVGVLTVFVVYTLSIAAIRIWGKRIYSPEVMRSMVPRNQIEWGLIIIPLLVAVTMEELLFRGLLIGGFQLVINPWAMALASSIIFGLMHSPQGSLGIVLTGMVGMAFGALFILTNSLLTVIVAHFVVNFLQLLRAQEDIAWYERFEENTRRRVLARQVEAETEAETELEADQEGLEATAPVEPLSATTSTNKPV